MTPHAARTEDIRLIAAELQPAPTPAASQQLAVPPAPDSFRDQNLTPPNLLPYQAPAVPFSAEQQPAAPLPAVPPSDDLPPLPESTQPPPAPLPDQTIFDPPAPADPTVEVTGDRVTLVVRDELLAVVLGMIAEQHGLNLVTGDEVAGRLTVTLKNVPLDDALDTILTANGYTWSRHHDILMVSSIATTTRMSPTAQGRVMRVFNLNFASATDVDLVIQGLLSPVGHSVVTVTSPDNTRRTREEIVVEDLPNYLARIEAYISQADVPPRQVHVEAHVLRVLLEDNTQHGVNINQLLRIDRKSVV